MKKISDKQVSGLKEQVQEIKIITASGLKDSGLPPDRIFEAIKNFFEKGKRFPDEDNVIWFKECGLSPRHIFVLIKIFFEKGKQFSDENDLIWLGECGLSPRQILILIQVRLERSRGKFSGEFENMLFDTQNDRLIRGYCAHVYPNMDMRYLKL